MHNNSSIKECRSLKKGLTIYQRGNQNPLIEEGQTDNTIANIKRAKTQIKTYKTLHRTRKLEPHIKPRLEV